MKPANILIDDDERAYLADFGIAKAVAGGDALTQTGLGVGTPEYMAPEQAQGRAEPRSDLYALGIMLFQLLTGSVPYSGASTVEVLLKQMQEPIPLGALHGPTARAFGPILTRALAKDPAARYPTGGALMDDANAALARLGHTDAEDRTAYRSGATQGPQRGTPAPTGVAPPPAPRQHTPPPHSPPAPDEATVVRPATGTPPASGPWTPATPATNAGDDVGGWGTSPADRREARPEPIRSGPDDATRVDLAGPTPPPPSRPDPAPAAADPAPPNAYRPPTFVGAAEVQMMRRKGGGPLANLDPNTRRLVIIIAVVVAVVLLLCCCLFGLAILGGR